MEPKKLNEVRVHELCEQYAQENQGQIPSTTQIILLNSGKGSPSSANIYRKTYLLRLEQAKPSASDPLSSFPEAVASAVKAMQGSIEAQTEERIDAMKVEVSTKEQAWAQEQEDLQLQLAAALKDNAGLYGQLREFTLLNETLTLEKAELEHVHNKATEKVKALEVELCESRGCSAELSRLLDGIRPTLTAHTQALSGVENAQAALEKQVVDSGETQAERIAHLSAAFKSVSGAVRAGYQLQEALIEANKDASENIAHQGSQYQAEIDRLNQLVDDLRQSLAKLKQADLVEVETALEKKMNDIATTSGDTHVLLQKILIEFEEQSRGVSYSCGWWHQK